MTVFTTLPPDVNDLVDQVCDAFERAWRDGHSPNIEDYLARAQAAHRTVLLGELLLADCECRRRAGDTPRPEDYLPRFTQHSEIVELVFRQLRTAEEQAQEQTPRDGARTAATPDLARFPLQVGGYELLEEIGRGGMGVVYKAKQPGLNRVVALKMLLAGAHADAEQRGRFRREAEAAARLPHQNIIQVHEIGEHAGQLYVSMEYVAGPSLDRLLANWHGQGQAGMTPSQAAGFIQALAAAVHVAHQHSIIHRDLKPANILLAPNPKSESQDRQQTLDSEFRIAEFSLKIADFGLAKLLGDGLDATGTGAILGTPTYMAPEQVEGKTDVIGAHTDVYALGTMLFELLTGRTPFRAATVAETLEQVRHDEPPLPSQLQPRLPRDLETICLTCLRKDPRQRYATAAALAHDLGRFLAGKPIQARRTGPVERALKWVKRRPAIAALLAAVVLVSAAAFAVLAHQWRETALALADKEKEFDRAEQNAASYLMALARTHWTINDFAKAKEYLERCPVTLRNDAWRELQRLCHAELCCVRLPKKVYMPWLEWSADGRQLVGALDTATIQVFDATSGATVKTIRWSERYPPPVAEYQMSGDRQSLFILAGETFAKNPKGRVHQLVRVDLFKETVTVCGEFVHNGFVALSPDAKCVAHGKPNDPITYVTEIETGKLVKSVGVPQGLDNPNAFFSPDGKLLARWHFGKASRLEVFDLASGTMRDQIDWDKTHNTLGFSFSADGSRLAYVPAPPSEARTATVYVRDLQRGKDVLTLPCEDREGRPLPTFSPDGSAIAWLGKRHNIHVASAVSGKLRLVLQGHDGPVFRLVYSPDGRRLASYSQDGTVRVWDVAD